MSNAAIIAICGVISLVIGQIATYRSSRRNGEKAEEIKAETKVITAHVNSAAAAASAKIDGLEKQVVELRELLAERKQTAALLAQAAVQAVQDSRAEPHAPVVAQPAAPSEVIVVNDPDNPVPTIAGKADK